MRLETERLILREWQDNDRAPYAEFNADAETRHYFYPPLKTAAETNVMVDEMITGLAENGFGFLAVERKSDGAFVGEVGLSRIDLPTQQAMERPAPIEFGWFFGRAYWGNGYATEAARAWLAHSLGELGLTELVSLACVGNAPSIHVMEKLGMSRDPQILDDPTVPVGHWQRPHVIYRISNPRRI